jgi:hypothetical protein
MKGETRLEDVQRIRYLKPDSKNALLPTRDVGNFSEKLTVLQLIGDLATFLDIKF